MCRCAASIRAQGRMQEAFWWQGWDAPPKGTGMLSYGHVWLRVQRDSLDGRPLTFVVFGARCQGRETSSFPFTVADYYMQSILPPHIDAYYFRSAFSRPVNGPGTGSTDFPP